MFYPPGVRVSPQQPEQSMKTGNGQTPNPQRIFGKGFARDNSNLVKGSIGKPFSAKKDSLPGNKKHG